MWGAFLSDSLPLSEALPPKKPRVIVQSDWPLDEIKHANAWFFGLSLIANASSLCVPGVPVVVASCAAKVVLIEIFAAKLRAEFYERAAFFNYNMKNLIEDGSEIDLPVAELGLWLCPERVEGTLAYQLHHFWERWYSLAEAIKGSLPFSFEGRRPLGESPERLAVETVERAAQDVRQLLSGLSGLDFNILGFSNISQKPQTFVNLYNAWGDLGNALEALLRVVVAQGRSADLEAHSIRTALALVKSQRSTLQMMMGDYDTLQYIEITLLTEYTFAYSQSAIEFLGFGLFTHLFCKPYWVEFLAKWYS